MRTGVPTEEVQLSSLSWYLLVVGLLCLRVVTLSLGRSYSLLSVGKYLDS